MRWKRWLCAALGAAILAGAASGCGKRPENEGLGQTTPPRTYALAQDYGVSAALLCCRHADPQAGDDTLAYLEQSVTLNLTVEVVDACDATPLDAYAVLYLDESLLDSPQARDLGDRVLAHTREGGYALVPNALYDFFPLEFLGAASFQRLEGLPTELEFPGVGGDLRALQEIVEDYASLLPSFSDYPLLAGQDYGFALVPDTAVPLVTQGEAALYAMNQYGQGRVFFTNPLLPNRYSLGSFTMEPDGESVTAFASTTASCNQLLLGGFAAYSAKQRYGYALNRVFGYYGSPSMSWELHYEEITGFEHDALQIFSDLCRAYQQIPSLTLIRNSYWWFRRAESVTFLLGQREAGPPSFAMDYHESAYSSGTHVDSDGSWLSLSSHEDAGSYFLDYPEYTYRAYPWVGDADGDGTLDLLSGSQDGQVYFYRGKGFTDRLSVGAAQALTDPAGQPLDLGDYSAPQLVDLDGDGALDLLCGAGDGRVYWFSGDGTLAFAPQGVLLDCEFRGQALPHVGDVDGDGVADLLVGSDQGILLLFYGAREGAAIRYSHGSMHSYSRLCADAELGRWLAPALTDWDGDGTADLAVGTFDGYVALLVAGDPGQFSFEGYLTAQEKNYKGNHNLKFGNWCVPVFQDLNGDGTADLLCGSQEYGLAYPIDSPYFPQAQQLARQMEYARENHYYVGVHFYTNTYASQAREDYELQAHLRALEHYGLETEGIGANQHTWYTSAEGPAQSLLSAYRAGLLWNSGFGSPGATWNTPQTAAENAIALPFFLLDGGERTLLVQNNSVLPYRAQQWQALSAKYRMPVCVYYHCDFVYRSEEGARADLQTLSDFRDQYGYNFNREDQLMRASAAAYQLAARVQGSPTDPAGLTLSAETLSRDFPLYRREVQDAMGLEIAFAQGLDPQDYAVDADVYHRDGSSLFVGLNRPVRIYPSQETAGPHLARVNLAAEIRTDGAGAEITFLEDGMLQAVVAGRAETASPGWLTQSQGDQTVFTKYGTGQTLQIRYVEEPADE